MLRKTMLATVAAASFVAGLAGTAPAQAEWRGGDHRGHGYERGHHDRSSWRPWHWRRHHDGYGEAYRYGPPWLRRWHWSHQATPRHHW
jgi:hypothetical protein